MGAGMTRVSASKPSLSWRTGAGDSRQGAAPGHLGGQRRGDQARACHPPDQRLPAGVEPVDPRCGGSHEHDGCPSPHCSLSHHPIIITPSCLQNLGCRRRSSQPCASWGSALLRKWASNCVLQLPLYCRRQGCQYVTFLYAFLCCRYSPLGRGMLTGAITSKADLQCVVLLPAPGQSAMLTVHLLTPNHQQHPFH